MRAVIATALMSFAFAGMAHADVVSYETMLTNQQYSPGNGDFAVSSAAFNSALGTLDSVTLTIDGTAEDKATGQGSMTPFAATFHNYGYAFMPGMPSSSLLSTTTGTATTDLADSVFAVGWSVSSTSDLGDYINPYISIDPVLFDFDFSSQVYNSAGQPVTYSNILGSFTGTITETFTYTAVPEPASWGILGVALATLLVARGASRRQA